VRIVHFIKWLRLKDGGTVRAVLDMCESLASRGHHVTALSTDDSGVPDSWKQPHPTNNAIPHNVLIELRDPLWQRRGRTMADATRDTLTQYLTRASMARAKELLKTADVLHVHGMWANCNHQLTNAARKLGIPYVISPHGMLDDWSMSQGAFKKKLHLSLISRRSLENARAIHCTARAELDQARKWFPNAKGKGVVIPLLFDTDQFKSLPGPELARSTFPAFQSGANLLTVLFLSRLHLKKGVEPLIRAAAAMNAARHPIRLLLAGPSDPPEYESHLRTLARDLGIDQTTHFLGMVTGPLKWSLYQAADVFVLPTSQENFGYVLLESLACGTPVITTKGVDIWPELNDSGGAIICEPQGPTQGTTQADALTDQLAREIQNVTANPARRESMSRAGRAWAMTFLDRQRILQALESAYTQTS